MIKKVTICKCPNLVYAKFDTKIASEGKDKGRRVRHLIYPDDEGLGYWHERRYLSEEALTVKPTQDFDLIISERVFFGKARLVQKRDLCLPETWIAIGETVQCLEKMMAREKIKKYKKKEKSKYEKCWEEHEDHFHIYNPLTCDGCPYESRCSDSICGY